MWELRSQEPGATVGISGQEKRSSSLYSDIYECFTEGFDTRIEW